MIGCNGNRDEAIAVYSDERCRGPGPLVYSFLGLKHLYGALGSHYDNTPVQYTAIFHGCKNANFQFNFFEYFHIFAQNIYCGYTLEPPQ